MSDNFKTSGRRIDKVDHEDNKADIIAPHFYFIISALLFLAAFPISFYPYYTLLRIVVCGFSFIVFSQNLDSSKQRPAWTWILLLIAIIFNPLLPIHMPKETWIVVDIVAGTAFLFLGYKAKLNQRNKF